MKNWREIIYRGAESEELDYKAAQNWNTLSRAGRSKFVRHCMAMANTKGGYVVVGVGEDHTGRPSDFTGLTPEQSKSFDPTSVGTFLARFSDPPVDFTLERPEVDGKCYAVFDIKPFRELPHVCTGDCEDELKRGVFYIRTKDASSRPAYRATEIHALIQRALRNQRELLGRMLRGILYENHTAIEESASRSLFAEELQHSRDFFRKRFSNDPRTAYFAEFCILPESYREDRCALTDLRNAAEEASFTYPDKDMIDGFQIQDSYFTNTSLRSFSDNGNAMLQLYRSGLFHCIARIPCDLPPELPFEQLAKLTARLVRFSSAWYQNLGFSEDLLEIDLQFNRMEGAFLQLEDGRKTKCRIPEIQVRMTRSASDYAAGSAEHAAHLLKSISERFNFQDAADPFFLSAVNTALLR